MAAAMDHDALNKLIFALPSVQADALRLVTRGWTHLLDLDTLERVSAEHPAEDLTRRAGDLAWRVRFRQGALGDGEPPWLLVPTECQSGDDRRMGFRVREYTERHLEALRREGAWSREGEEPLVLPLVIYDGAARWRRGDGPLGRLPESAALALAPLQPGRYLLLDAGAGALEDWPAGNRVTAWVRLLRAGTAAELRAALSAGLAEFPGRGDLAYRNALRKWAVALLRAKAWNSDDITEFEDDLGEDEMASLLDVNFRKWEAGLIEQGRTEGIERGMERGLAQGLLRGRSEERERLRRELSALQLDPETAAQVSELLDPGG